MTVSTFFAEAADDWIASVSFVDWAAAQAGGESVFAVQGTSFLLAYITGDGAWAVYEAFLSFDTSSIPDTDTVSAFVLSLAGTGTAEQDEISGATIQAREHDWGTGVTTADWVDGSTPSNWTGKTLIADFDPTGWVQTDGTYNDFTQQGAVTVINKTGDTRMVIGPSGISGSDPGVASSGVEFWGEGETGTTKDAKLVVTHAADGDFEFALTHGGKLVNGGMLRRGLVR